MRSPQPQQLRSPQVLQLSPVRSNPLRSARSPLEPSRATSYLSATPATARDRSPQNRLGSSLPTSSRDAELAEFGELGERLSQTFAKMELLGQELNTPRGIPGKGTSDDFVRKSVAAPSDHPALAVSSDISLTDEIATIRKEREELQKRYALERCL
jgi:hypothetical protein